MLQTAASISHSHYLQIAGKEITDINTGISLPGEELNSPFNSNQLFQKAAPFYYNDRVRLSFSIAEKFTDQFILIKGLIEFNRPKHFSFTYNPVQKTVETDIEVNQIKELQSFYTSVYGWLKKEIQFKDTLKLILDWENRNKKEMAAVYSLLHNQ
jgi:hypothetical protein